MARFLLGVFLLLAIVNVSIQAPTFTAIENFLKGLQGIFGGGFPPSRQNVYVPGSLGGPGGQGSVGGTVYLPGSTQYIDNNRYGYPDSSLYGPGWQGYPTNGRNIYYQYQ